MNVSSLLDPLLIVELAALGLGTGFLAGLLGIGGGMLMVPFITIIMGHRGVPADLSVKMAIATSMATIIFTSVSSVRAHHKRGAVRWEIVRRLAPGIVIGSLVGSLGVFALLKGTALAIFFALFVGFSATQMFLDKKPAPTRQMPGTAKGVMFMTLEDETGCVNLIVRPELLARQRRETLDSRLLAVSGVWQVASDVRHLVAQHFEDLTPLLGGLRTSSREFH